jgi:signal recognition particle receptor subunit beta
MQIIRTERANIRKAKIIIAGKVRTGKTAGAINQACSLTVNKI